MLTSALPSLSPEMTATAPVLLALGATPVQHEPMAPAHRRLQMQLIPLSASNYSPDALISAIGEFCRARRLVGIPPAQVLIECTTLAASRLDSAGVRLVEVLARQSIVCPVTEQLDRLA
jgi:hypothetical protein